MSAHILCVDDDANDLELENHLLRKAGYRVSLAQDTRSAMEIFMRDSIDLVLLDFAMPGTDGGILAFEMRRRMPNVKVAFFCGEPNAPMPRHIVDAVIGKNIGSEEILDAVRRLLDGSTTQAA